MHELLKHVLKERDLTRAGDIFSIPDSEIVDDLAEVIKQIIDISSRPDYIHNDRDQAVVEICVTKTTSCIKATGTLDKYCEPLVSLLESCLHHSLMPVGRNRDEDPPHAKIASDILACIVLVSFPVQSDKESYDIKTVMKAFLPVAVQFLHKGNRELSRHMAQYLSLAAVSHSLLLKPHVQTIMDSIMSGNYPLCRILTNLYKVCPDPLEGHITALVSLLPHAEQVEQDSLFALFEQTAVRRAEALKTSIPQLLSYLCPNTADQNDPSCMCIDILQLFVSLSRRRVTLLLEHGATVRQAARPPHASHKAIMLVAEILTKIGQNGEELAREALNFVLEKLPIVDKAQQTILIRWAKALCSDFPNLFNDRLLDAVRATGARPKSMISGQVNQTSSGVTIVNLGGGQGSSPGVSGGPVVQGAQAVSVPTGGYTRRAKLGDSRSTGRLHTGAAAHTHRSVSRLNVAGGSVGGLHKSMTRLSSSQQMHSHQQVVTAQIHAKQSTSSIAEAKSSGSVTVTTISPQRVLRPTSRGIHHQNILIGSPAASSALTTSHHQPQSISVNPLTAGKSTDGLTPIKSSVSVQHSTALGHISVIPSAAPSGSGITATSGSGPITNPVSISGPVTVISRRANNTSVTVINSGSANTTSNATNRISVFEPYPMRDTVQHFSEKHLDKIKTYMDGVSVKLPPPAKCTIEERRSKKLARLEFACGARGPHCLFSRSLFSIYTKAPRVWIHLMFLALQARHSAALSSRDPSVSSLKYCWEILKSENKTFVTLVTGAFPAMKDQDMLVSELKVAGFFDLFELNTKSTDGETLPPTKSVWGCFLCTHPDRAIGFLSSDGQPVIEGQLKEKKGRWRLFRRWRTRYFTLSGAHLSCKGSSGGDSIDLNQVRSVKVSRGARNIPKAFEIFTGDQTFILKPKDGKNAEEWAQCLSIAVAHLQARDVPVKANSLPARGLTLRSF